MRHSFMFRRREYNTEALPFILDPICRPGIDMTTARLQFETPFVTKSEKMPFLYEFVIKQNQPVVLYGSGSSWSLHHEQTYPIADLCITNVSHNSL